MKHQLYGWSLFSMRKVRVFFMFDILQKKGTFFLNQVIHLQIFRYFAYLCTSLCFNFSCHLYDSLHTQCFASSTQNTRSACDRKEIKQGPMNSSYFPLLASLPAGKKTFSGCLICKGMLIC